MMLNESNEQSSHINAVRELGLGLHEFVAEIPRRRPRRKTAVA